MKKHWIRALSLTVCVLLAATAAGCGGRKPVNSSTAASSSGRPGTAESSGTAGTESDVTESETPESQNTGTKSSSRSGGSSVSAAPQSSAKSSRPNDDDGELPLPDSKKAAWKQPQFFLATFRGVERGGYEDEYEKSVRAHKEAGFNLIENAILATEDMYRALDACEKVGVKCLAQDISSFSGMGDKYPLNNEAMLLDVVRKLNQYKMLEGYYLWDEPGEAQFAKHKTINAFFKKTDPARLAYSLVLPSYGVYTWSANHANWANDSYKRYVDGYLSAVNPDVVCVDYYPFRSSLVSINESYMWRDLGYLRKRALELKKPLWFYFQADAMDCGLNDLPIVNMKVQMYSALAYGVTGLSYYMSIGVLVDKEGNKTSRFEELKAMNKEVVNLGNLLFGKTSGKLYHTGVGADKQAGYFTNELASDDMIQSLPDGVIAGVFTDGSGAKYLVIVNKSFSGALSGELVLKSAKNVKSYNKKTNATTQVSSSTRNVALSIPAGDCAVFVIQ